MRKDMSMGHKSTKGGKGMASSKTFNRGTPTTTNSYPNKKGSSEVSPVMKHKECFPKVFGGK